MSLSDFSLPAAVDLSGAVDEHASMLHLYQRCRQQFFRQSVQEILVAIFVGVCERAFCLTFALLCYPEYLEFFRRCAVPWVPDFFHAPIDQGSPSGPPPEVGPTTRSPGAVSPVSPPPSRLPLARLPREGPRRFALTMAGFPLLPATSCSPTPCAPAVARPADGLPRWRLLALHFRRRSRVAPRRRGSARVP